MALMYSCKLITTSHTNEAYDTVKRSSTFEYEHGREEEESDIHARWKMIDVGRKRRVLTVHVMVSPTEEEEEEDDDE